MKHDLNEYFDIYAGLVAGLVVAGLLLICLVIFIVVLVRRYVGIHRHFHNVHFN